MTDPVIETYKLRKDYGSKIAVSDLTLTVNQGEVFGFLGQNGAGKTTSVKMLLGLIFPTSGEGMVLGKSLGNTQARNYIGFLPEHFQFHHWLSGPELLRFHGELYNLPRKEIDKRCNELLELVDLAKHGKKKLREYSKGMLQRIGLAQALLPKPDLVILDEPTSGLDPLGRRLVRDIIRKLKNEGKTIFINSHLLSEIEAICDRVAFIKEGIVIKITPLEELLEEKCSIEIVAKNINQAIIRGLTKFGWDLTKIDIPGGFSEIRIEIKDEINIPKINFYLVDNGVEIYSIKQKPKSLEDLFLNLMEDKIPK